MKIKRNQDLRFIEFMIPSVVLTIPVTYFFPLEYELYISLV